MFQYYLSYIIIATNATLLFKVLVVGNYQPSAVREVVISVLAISRVRKGRDSDIPPTEVNVDFFIFLRYSIYRIPTVVMMVRNGLTNVYILLTKVEERL